MKILLTTLLLLIAATAWAGADKANAILGLWATEPTEEGYAHVEIAREDERYVGHLVWLKLPNFEEGHPRAGQPKVDENNPDPELRDRSVIGLRLLWDFAYKGELKWEGGRIYDPENGKTYKCKMWLEGENTLKVRGYIGFSLLGRNTEWTRVTESGEPAPAQPVPEEEHLEDEGC